MKAILRFILLVMLLSLPVRAEDKPQAPAQETSASQPSAPSNRPNEGDLFGAPATPATPADQDKPSAPANNDQHARPPETDLFQSSSKEPVLSKNAGPEDPLKIGGVFYLRMLTGAREGQGIRDFRFSTPMLVDTYLDARPNDRVHAELVGRITYDPTGNSNQHTVINTMPTSSPETTLLSVSSTTSTDPQFILNQFWIRFDIARTVFVTAGKQSIKWGTAHFWNPTDFLQPVRNPLEPFDIRTGTTMLKFHLPWEKYGWNLYAVALLQKPTTPQSLIDQTHILLNQNQKSSNFLSTFNLGNLGGAVRAEFVFSTFEIGADFVARDGQRPKYGFDISAGLDSLLHIPIDIYAEVALRHGSDTTRYSVAPLMGTYSSQLTIGNPYNPDEISPQVSCGLNWSTLYNDQDQIIVGAEYFYNSLGYGDDKLYLWLMLNGAFQPFYLGRHYAALYISLPNPGSWDNTIFTLSGLGNLSDSSFIIRLDYSVLVLTYLKIEAYVAGYLGAPGGEFRLKINTPGGTYPIEQNTLITIPAFHLTAPIVDVGISLRIDI